MSKKYCYMIVGAPSNQRQFSISTLYYKTRHKIDSFDKLNKIKEEIKKNNNWDDFQFFNIQLLGKEYTWWNK